MCHASFPQTVPMRPDLPQLLLSVRPGPRGAPLRPVTAADAEGPGVALLAAGQHPAPLRFQTGERDLVVFGTPFLEDASDRLNVARRIADSEDPTEAVARLNGEFGLILHDTREGTLDLFTDRHGAWPFF